jgi:fimbrial chaperone protein
LKWIRTGWLLAAFILLAPAFVWAGSFKAVPIKLYFDARVKSAVLKITNEGDEKVTVQLDAMQWGQNEKGKDLFEETGDIVFFPTIVDIEKGEERIVRVGFQGQRALGEERTYRLFLEELPVTKPGVMALKFALRISIPIFIRPQKEAVEWAIDGVDLAGQRLAVRVRNSGNSHIFINKIRATGIDASGKEVFSRDVTGWYTLPGASKAFAMGVTPEECLNTGTIKLIVETGAAAKEATLEVDRAMCSPKPE